MFGHRIRETRSKTAVGCDEDSGVESCVVEFVLLGHDGRIASEIRVVGAGSNRSTGDRNAETVRNRRDHGIEPVDEGGELLPIAHVEAGWRCPE